MIMESGAGLLKAMEGVTGTHAQTGGSAIRSRHVGRTATDLLSAGVPAKYNGGMIDEVHELCLGSWTEWGVGLSAAVCCIVTHFLFEGDVYRILLSRSLNVPSTYYKYSNINLAYNFCNIQTSVQRLNY